MVGDRVEYDGRTAEMVWRRRFFAAGDGTGRMSCKVESNSRSSSPDRKNKVFITL